MSLTNLSTKRQRIAELARSKRGVALSALHHVIDLEWLKEAYRLTRKDGAPGIDGGLTFSWRGSPRLSGLSVFSLVFGITFQVSDVQISARKFRRLAAVHGPISFLF